MTTAVDTNILLALLIPSAPAAGHAARVLGEAETEGPLIFCEAVGAELSAHFDAPKDPERFIAETRLRLVPSTVDVLFTAGQAWAVYSRRRPTGLVCARCGNEQAVRCDRCNEPIRPRQHIVADFLIGAHALVHAGRLLTLDPRCYRTYFPELRLP